MNIEQLSQLILDLVKKECNQPIPEEILITKVFKSTKNYLDHKLVKDTINKLIDEDLLRRNFYNKIIIGYINAPKILNPTYIGQVFVKTNLNASIEMIDNDESISFFVHKSNLNNALNGDTVEFCLLDKLPNKHGIKEAAVLKVLTHNKNTYVATININTNGVYSVEFDDKKMYLKAKINNLFGVVDGSKVLLSIDNVKNNIAYCSVIKVIGHKNDIGCDILSIVYENDINPDFKQSIIDDANECLKQDINWPNTIRRDITSRHIISIDPETSKDLDDAIYVEKLPNGNYLLGVSIADVSSYIKPESEFDLFTRARGTSVYLTDRVIPMIPHSISNDLGSLNYNQKRRCLTCDMEINPNGDIIKQDVYPALMINHDRLSYDQVNLYYQNIKNEELSQKTKKILDVALELHYILRKKKNIDGYVQLDINEPKIIQNSEGFPIKISFKDRGISNFMIEDFMVAANNATTIIANNLKLPFIYRIHEKPSPESVNNLSLQLSKLGFRFNSSDVTTLTNLEIANIVNKNLDSQNIKMLYICILRSMQKAIYSTSNIGHFGLAINKYTHFTSPIRRYADLIVHRIFWMYLFAKDLYSDKQRQKLEESLDEICNICNQTELKAVKTERQVNTYKFCQFMSQFIDYIFLGTITGLTSYGAFIELDNSIEGLLPIQNMSKEFMYFDQEQFIIHNKTNTISFKFGQKIKIQIDSVDLNNKKITFKLAHKDDAVYDVNSLEVVKPNSDYKKAIVKAKLVI